MEGNGTATLGRFGRSLDPGQLEAIRVQMGGGKPILELTGNILLNEFESAIYTIDVNFR